MSNGDERHGMIIGDFHSASAGAAYRVLAALAKLADSGASLAIVGIGVAAA